MKLAKWSGIKWVADFRDPWTKIYHYNRSKKLKCSLLLDEKLEYQVVKSANSLATVSNNIANLLKHTSVNKFTIIPNGYDEEDFLGLNTRARFDKFTLSYAGKMNNQQNPAGLWIALRQLIDSDNNFAKNFQMLFMGDIAQDIIREIKNYKLDSYCKFTGYIEHKSMLENILKSDILLLLIPNTKDNEGIVTGKLFEYLATGNFILGIGPKNGDADKILQQTNTGKMFEFNEFDGIKKEIEKQYENWENGVKIEVNKNEIEKYSRRKLTCKLTEIFDSLI
jgi:glycosyltransferase involved in cell wall biosynthesis